MNNIPVGAATYGWLLVPILFALFCSRLGSHGIAAAFTTSSRSRAHDSSFERHGLPKSRGTIPTTSPAPTSASQILTGAGKTAWPASQ